MKKLNTYQLEVEDVIYVLDVVSLELEEIKLKASHLESGVHYLSQLKTSLNDRKRIVLASNTISLNEDATFDLYTEFEVQFSTEPTHLINQRFVGFVSKESAYAFLTRKRKEAKLKEACDEIRQKYLNEQELAIKKIREEVEVKIEKEISILLKGE